MGPAKRERQTADLFCVGSFLFDREGGELSGRFNPYANANHY